LCLIAAWWALASGPNAGAEQMRQEPVPFSVWLDFDALSRPNPPRVSLPIWLESVQSDHPKARKGEPERTIVRLRLRRIGLLNREIQLRLFFDDQPGSAPSVSGWTETGRSRFQSGPLGAALSLPSSETVIVPVEETDYLEITVPGDGRTLRGAFLSTVQIVQARQSLDLGVAPPYVDPFGSPWTPSTPLTDTYLYGRVKASLEPQPLKIMPTVPADWSFELDRLPLIAVLSFQVLHLDLSYPPEVRLNGKTLGAAVPQLPDLADPGYRGEVRPLESDMRFHYTGWLRCQVRVPASALRTGVNELRLTLGRHTGPVAVRAVELQLKHNSRDLDYTIVP
jgi:hypothetical protein